MSVLHTAFTTSLIILAVFTSTGYLACKKDPCKGVVCKNGGSCTDGKCICPTGYEGIDCAILSRDKFIGTWNGDENCASGGYLLTSEIKMSNDPTHIIVSNPGGYGDTETITGVLTMANKISFTNQGLSENTMLNGVMTFTDGKLNFVYVAGSGPDADSCVGVYTKQQ